MLVTTFQLKNGMPWTGGVSNMRLFCNYIYCMERRIPTEKWPNDAFWTEILLFFCIMEFPWLRIMFTCISTFSPPAQASNCSKECVKPKIKRKLSQLLLCYWSHCCAFQWKLRNWRNESQTLPKQIMFLIHSNECLWWYNYTMRTKDCDTLITLLCIHQRFFSNW